MRVLLAASLLLLMTVWQGRSAEFPAITVTSATESETVGHGLLEAPVKMVDLRLSIEEGFADISEE